MLRFTLFGFPINIQWPFWLVTALLGGALDARGTFAVRALLVWIGVVFVSIILHELGHALAMRHFGDRRVSITLHAMGGYTQGSGWRGRNENIMISAAGPAASLLIGSMGWVLFEILPPSSRLITLGFLYWKYVNIVWALVNLLPVIPLDGGHISAALHGSERVHAALKLSFYSAIGVAVLCVLVWGQLFTAMFFAMLAWNNWQVMKHGDEIRWMR